MNTPLNAKNRPAEFHRFDVEATQELREQEAAGAWDAPLSREDQQREDDQRDWAEKVLEKTHQACEKGDMAA